MMKCSVAPIVGSEALRCATLAECSLSDTSPQVVHWGTHTLPRKVMTGLLQSKILIMLAIKFCHAESATAVPLALYNETLEVRTPPKDTV